MKGLHLYETDMHKIALILIITSLLFVSSCKDDEETEPIWDPSGLYTLDISVTSRPPAIITDDSILQYNHQFLYSEIFDTTQTKCCYWRFSKHDCPPTYSVSNVRIFESEGQYYLYNGIDYSGGNQISFHIPLSIDDNTLRLETNIPKNEKSFHLASLNSIMTSTAESWPTWFDLIHFQMNKLEDGTTSGSWAIIDKSEYCTTTMSDGSTQSYYMSEFADITFTRIGD